MVNNKQIIYAQPPEGLPKPGEHMKVKESSIDLDAELPEGDILLKTLEISIDTYMRGLMRDPSVKSYADAYTLNEPMTSDTLSVVIKSNNSNFKVGDIVYGRSGMGPLVEYFQANAEYAKKAFVVRNEAKTSGLPLSNYVGALAVSGMTAYYGVEKIGKPKKGETFYVSSAASAVGQLAGQLGKAAGARVVGSAGNAEKVEYLKSIGFDAAFNYKEGDIEENLRKHCPDGIDVYFENVGGKMLDAVLATMNNYGRIIGCGSISQKTKRDPIYNSSDLVFKTIKFESFIVLDHIDEIEKEFFKKMTSLLADGAIKFKEHIINGINNAPQALVDVLEGTVLGKVVIHVADL